MSRKAARVPAKGTVTAVCAAVVFVLSVAFWVNELVVDEWPGIVRTAGGVPGNVAGWVMIYALLGFAVSLLITAASVPVCVLIEIVYRRRRRARISVTA
jgi:hypothetical protein